MDYDIILQYKIQILNIGQETYFRVGEIYACVGMSKS